MAYTVKTSYPAGSIMDGTKLQLGLIREAVVYFTLTMLHVKSCCVDNNSDSGIIRHVSFDVYNVIVQKSSS